MKVTFSGVSLTYPYEQAPLLKDLTFALQEQVNTILCDTQSGKSTLCKLLTKEIAPTTGSVLVDGNDICSVTNRQLGVLWLPSNPTFFDNRTVLFNVAYPLLVRGSPKRGACAVATKVAAKVGITHLLNCKVKTLSGEQRKCVALARGLTVCRKLVLWDDFFAVGNQNDDTSIDFCNQIQSALSLFGNATHLILTSNPSLAMGHTVVLDGGTTIFEGNNLQAQKVAETLFWLAKRI